MKEAAMPSKTVLEALKDLGELLKRLTESHLFELMKLGLLLFTAIAAMLILEQSRTNEALIRAGQHPVSVKTLVVGHGHGATNGEWRVEAKP